MNILILYRHFWPDSPPYASMLRTLGAHLVREGHQVTIWCQQPCYKAFDHTLSAPARETLDGIRVERLSPIMGSRRLRVLELADKVLWPIRLLTKAAWRRLRGDRYDLVWTATIPPVASGLAGRLIADMFGARFLYHCQDVYPELAGHTGLWGRGGLIYKLAAGVERGVRRRADLLVTLSDDMANTIRRLGEPKRLAVINNFLLEDFSGKASRPVRRARDDDRIQIIFAGNMGQFQGLEAVVDAMRLVQKSCPRLELLLMGEGKALPELRRRAEGLDNVRFAPHCPVEEAHAAIAAADVGLVTLEEGIYRYAFPSKTLTYLGLGIPILAVIEPESELAAMIRNENLGWVAPGREPEAIARGLEQLHQSWPAQARKRSDLAHATSLDQVKMRWSQIVSDLENPQ